MLKLTLRPRERVVVNGCVIRNVKGDRPLLFGSLVRLVLRNLPIIL